MTGPHKTAEAEALVAGRRLTCRLIGHRRRWHEGERYRHGRWRTLTYAKCLRCGCSDPAEVHRDGLLEPLVWWRLVWTFRALRARLRKLIHENCTLCGKPYRRFGRKVGQHEECDEIPF